MEGFVYLTGAVYIAVTLARLTFWVVDIIEGRAKKMNKYQRKKAALRKKGVKKERYFIRNGESKWEFVEVSEAEAMRQTDVVLWEEEEPGEWWAVYRGDLLI